MCLCRVVDTSMSFLCTCPYPPPPLSQGTHPRSFAIAADLSGHLASRKSQGPRGFHGEFHGKMGWKMVECLEFFPTCQVRVVRFYVSCLLPPPHASCLLVVLPPPPASCRLLPPPASSSSSSSSLSSSSSSLSSSNCDLRSTAFPAGPQPRPSTPSVPCRTSTTTIHAQCSLPDLNHDHPRPVFPAGPQPRVSTPSGPCRTSTASIHAKCSLPDLM